jgi:hypothetical protein
LRSLLARRGPSGDRARRDVEHHEVGEVTGAVEAPVGILREVRCHDMRRRDVSEALLSHAGEHAPRRLRADVVEPDVRVVRLGRSLPARERDEALANARLRRHHEVALDRAEAVVVADAHRGAGRQRRLPDHHEAPRRSVEVDGDGWPARLLRDRRERDLRRGREIAQDEIAATRHVDETAVRDRVRRIAVQVVARDREVAGRRRVALRTVGR